MVLQWITPRIELSAYIDRFWLFQNDLGVPAEDNRIIAPNGKAKLIYPFLNSLSATDQGIKNEYPEGKVYFIGIWDRPVVLSSHTQITGTIGIEFSPAGLHRLVPFSLSEITNCICYLTDLYGQKAADLIRQLSEAPSVAQKINLLQEFLVALMQRTNRSNPLIDFSVGRIQARCGLIEMKELEKKTGYSKRYLDLLFRDHLGISPKTLASIVRFQNFYQSWADEKGSLFYRNDLYDLYYDQAHFIKEFKRFTGYSPKRYAQDRNEFGRIFYKR